MINRVFDRRIIEEIQTDEMGIDRIGKRRYSYMIVAYELRNLSGTTGSKGELGYIRRGHFSKQQPARTSSSAFGARVACTS